MNTIRTALAALATTLALGIAAPALADEPASVPVDPSVAAPVVDTQQPPARVSVLPGRCVGTGTMPTNARVCKVLDHGKRSPLVVVWGDSHSWQQTRGIIAAARANGESLVTFQQGACPPMILTQAESGTPCADLGRAAIRTIRYQARTRRVTVVLGGYWDGYRTLAVTPDDTYLSRQASLFRVGGPRAFRTLARLAHVRTVGIGQQPALGVNVAVPSADLPRTQVVRHEARNAAWLASHVDRVVSPTALLCDAVTCLSSIDGVSTYTDSLHLDPALSDLLAPAYQRALR